MFVVSHEAKRSGVLMSQKRRFTSFRASLQTE